MPTKLSSFYLKTGKDRINEHIKFRQKIHMLRTKRNITGLNEDFALSSDSETDQETINERNITLQALNNKIKKARKRCIQLEIVQENMYNSLSKTREEVLRILLDHHKVKQDFIALTQFSLKDQSMPEQLKTLHAYFSTMQENEIKCQKMLEAKTNQYSKATRNAMMLINEAPSQGNKQETQNTLKIINALESRYEQEYTKFIETEKERAKQFAEVLSQLVEPMQAPQPTIPLAYNWPLGFYPAIPPYNGYPPTNLPSHASSSSSDVYDTTPLNN